MCCVTVDWISMDHAGVRTDGEADELVREIGIPPCPAILTGFMHEMQRDEPDFRMLGKLISSDVALASATLKTVNSTFFGLQKRATSVRHALEVLGLRNAANLVAGLLLRQAFPSEADARMQSYWSASTAIAELNALLADELGCLPRDEAYTFGLFRDCGVPAMLANFGDYEWTFPGAMRPGGIDVVMYEEDLYGIDHARVGTQLARSWLLSDELCSAVFLHHVCHEPEGHPLTRIDDGLRHIALSHLAEILYARHHGLRQDDGSMPDAAFSLKMLKVSAERFDEAAVAVLGRYGETR